MPQNMPAQGPAMHQMRGSVWGRILVCEKLELPRAYSFAFQALSQTILGCVPGYLQPLFIDGDSTGEGLVILLILHAQCGAEDSFGFSQPLTSTMF